MAQNSRKFVPAPCSCVVLGVCEVFDEALHKRDTRVEILTSILMAMGHQPDFSERDVVVCGRRCERDVSSYNLHLLSGATDEEVLEAMVFIV